MYTYNEIRPTLTPYLGEVPTKQAGTQYPTYTYKLDIERGRMSGHVDGLEAIKQMVYKILDTPKGVYPIYSSSYGLWLDDLIGQSHSIARVEIKRRVREQIMVDERIQEVTDFDFQSNGNIMNMRMKVIATSGDVFEVERGYDLS